MKKLLVVCSLLLVVGLFIGCAAQDPQIIIYKYNYASPPGTPPDYQTIYGSAWNDPSLVIFKNDSYRRVRIEIDGRKPIVLAAYGATADLHLGVGEYRVRAIIEKPTASHGIWEVVRFFKIYIRPEGRSQIFHIYDY